MNNQEKIQHLVMSTILEKGYIELQLPDGMKVELGILKEDKNGDLSKESGYSWVIATQHDRVAYMDSYNLGIKFDEDEDKFIFEDSYYDSKGKFCKTLDVI